MERVTNLARGATREIAPHRRRNGRDGRRGHRRAVEHRVVGRCHCDRGGPAKLAQHGRAIGAGGAEHLGDADADLLVHRHAHHAERVVDGRNRASDVGAMEGFVGKPRARSGQVDAIDLVADQVFICHFTAGVDDTELAARGQQIAQLVGLNHGNAIRHQLRTGAEHTGADSAGGGREGTACDIGLDAVDMWAALQGRKGFARQLDGHGIHFVEAHHLTPASGSDRSARCCSLACLEHHDHADLALRLALGPGKWLHGRRLRAARQHGDRLKHRSGDTGMIEKRREDAGWNCRACEFRQGPGRQSMPQTGGCDGQRARDLSWRAAGARHRRRLCGCRRRACRKCGRGASSRPTCWRRGSASHRHWSCPV